MASSRWILFAVVLAGCTETGAHLTLSAPDGPSNATSFRVVLATKDEVPAIQNQRLAPRDPSTRTVSYFKQKTLAGAQTESIDHVDGFTLRIAPDSALTETQFIPFVLMYDGADRITGIATFNAGDAEMPAPILVVRDEIAKYALTVEKTAQIDDDAAELGPGELRVVTCYRDDQSSFASGIVWHTLDGKELRLLLPDDGALDATGRPLDMDCDGHAVTPESSRADCDDTRPAFHEGAPEACDGMDTSCNGGQTIATACTASSDCDPLFGQTGVALCDDTTEHTTQCQPVASCGCAATGGGCRFCEVPIAKSVLHANESGWLDVCYPAIGTLSLAGYCNESSPCDVEVVGMRGGWKLEVSAPAANAFGPRAYDVGETLAVRAKRAEDPATYEVMAAPLSATGEIDLAIITASGLTYLPLGLRLGESIATTCAPSPMLTCY